MSTLGLNVTQQNECRYPRRRIFVTLKVMALSASLRALLTLPQASYGAATLSITTLSILTLSIMTLSIITVSITIGKMRNTQHNNIQNNGGVL